MLAYLIFVIHFVISLLTSTNNLSKHSGVILNLYCLLFYTAFRKENIHLIPNWFRSSCSQISVFKTSQNSRENTLLESLFNNVAGLKTWNFIKKRLWHSYFPVSFLQFSQKTLFTEHLWMIAPADSFVPTKVLSVDHFLLVFSFIFFSFITGNCSYGSLLRKCLKMKLFFYFIK